MLLLKVQFINVATAAAGFQIHLTLIISCCVTKTKHPPTLTSELHLRKKKINSSSGRNNILDLTLYVSCRTGLLVFVHTVPRCFSTWSCLWPFTDQIIYGWTTPRVETEQTNHELIWIWHISSYTCTPFTIILTKINTFCQYFFFFAENFENWAEKECFVLVYFHLIVYQPQKQLPSAVNDMTLFYWA